MNGILRMIMNNKLKKLHRRCKTSTIKFHLEILPLQTDQIMEFAFDTNKEEVKDEKEIDERSRYVM